MSLLIECYSLVAQTLFLMLVAQEIVHGLHRIECTQGYFNEDGVPITHGTVTQTGKFERLQRAATL